MSTGTGPATDRPAVDLSLLVVRVVAGFIMAAHGAQKMFGAFGGAGPEKMVEQLGPISATWSASASSSAGWAWRLGF